MNLVEQLAAEKKAAQTLISKGADNLTEEQVTELKQHYAEAKRLQERIDLFSGVKNLTDDHADPAPQAKGARTLGDHYAAELKHAGLTVREAKQFATTDYKAATDIQTVGDGAAGTGYQPIITQIDMNGVWPYERPLVVADLLGTVTLSGNANTVEYPVYGPLEGGAGTVSEGGKKPQTHLPAPSWKADSLKEVAAWWKVTDNMAEDLAYIVSEINNHARYNLQLLEETQLLSGDGIDANINGLLNREGIQAMGQGTDSDPDRIFKARTKIALATGFRADALVINPADYETIRLSKDANGQYYGGGYFNGQYGNGTIMQDPPLWGLKTVVTEAIAQGTALVGAFKLGGAVIRKGGLRAESTNSHAEDFTSDLITFRVRERIGLQVKYPQAFVKVTLGKATK
ncbi:phage major capsid protein [Bifidobacterium platyrrhinorum]|uniref:Phage major capsid protein n=1 Tax=Bifidobacterium platyrrhinorum TaxID=2661628 RepID=A0A6L9SVG7_9BIFI|nr:phage major capsid protein [Bifidobacterium platyrrhinorum]NEG56139.1 phage major capsid protein [Bifidobacterium platyrrhinorum]